jgi:hypothetical protein
MTLEDEQRRPRFLIRDRDRKFTAASTRSSVLRACR